MNGRNATSVLLNEKIEINEVQIKYRCGMP